MYKTTSDNSQVRDRRGATENRSNSAGIDPTAFEQDAQRQRLVMRKRELEGTVFAIGETIRHSQRKFMATGQRGSQDVYEQWQKKRAAAVKELLDIDRQLAQLRLQRLSRENDSSLQKDANFDVMFHVLAKEMLAGPVYDRIATATIHRMST